MGMMICTSASNHKGKKVSLKQQAMYYRQQMKLNIDLIKYNLSIPDTIIYIYE